MPTYEYACSTCATNHEVVQPITDATLTICPVCGDPGLRKLFSNVGVVFKGSGFYRTDSRDKKSDSAASDTKASDTKASDTKASDTKASDTKASDTKASDTKASDTKASDTKAREPAKKAEAAPKTSAPAST